MNTRLIESTTSAYAYPLLIKRLLMSTARFEPNNRIHYQDQSFSYDEFRQRVARLAHALTAQGVKPGDTVAVLDWDSHRYLECFFAIPMIGAVLHTVNIRMSPDQILYTMNHAEDDVVLVHDDFLPLLGAVRDKLTTVKRCIQLTDDVAAAAPFEVVGEYEQLLSECESEYDYPDFDENSMATLFYTTGTTGNPKGVFFSHKQLVLHTQALLQTVGCFEGLPLMNSGSVYMPVTPMFHVHAWGIPYAATMLGITQIYPGRYEPNNLVSLIDRYKVSFSHCVPTILQMLLSADGATADVFNGWKVIIGGSALPKGLALKAEALGMDVYTAYGMSETCPLLTITHLNQHMRSQSREEQLNWRLKTGIPVSMVDMRVIDEAGHPLPEDGQSCGEIVVRAPWLTQAYLHEADKSEELWEDGWLHTGDIGCLHPGSFLEVRDRLKDVIKTGGEWVSSLELESLISSHPDVEQVAVVGMPCDQWGERPMALIVSHVATLDGDAIREHLQVAVDEGHINKWAIPSLINIVTDIPRTSVGKLDKKRIRSEYL